MITEEAVIVEAVEESGQEIPQELEVVITESGLAPTDADVIKTSYAPFFHEINEIKKEIAKINFSDPTELDEEIARKLRLRMVKVRTGSEEVKKDRKRIHDLRAGVEQSAWNLIKASCMLTEEELRSVENHREIMRQRQIETIKAERIQELTPYAEYVPMGINLGTMSKDDYEKVLSGAKLQMEAAIEARRKEAEAQAEKERIHRLHVERKESLMATGWQFVPEEIRAENFGSLTDSEWKLLVKLVKKSSNEYQQEQQRIREENERLQAEKELAEAKAKKERETLEAKLKAEREAREKAEAEMKSRADAEAKAKKEAEEQEKARIAAEKKAAKAPEKKRLSAWVSAMVIPQMPSELSLEAEQIGHDIQTKFDAFQKWAAEQINSL